MRTRIGGVRLVGALASGALCALAALFASACSDDEESPPKVSYCDVVPVLEARCRRCHGEPQANGAPISLATLEAIHAEYPPGSGRAASHMMVQMIEGGWMPPLTLQTDDGQGPVAPLGEEQRSLLLEWLRDGAPRGDCGAP